MVFRCVAKVACQTWLDWPSQNFPTISTRIRHRRKPVIKFTIITMLHCASLLSFSFVWNLLFPELAKLIPGRAVLMEYKSLSDMVQSDSICNKHPFVVDTDWTSPSDWDLRNMTSYNSTYNFLITNCNSWVQYLSSFFSSKINLIYYHLQSLHFTYSVYIKHISTWMMTLKMILLLIWWVCALMVIRLYNERCSNCSKFTNVNIS